MRHTDHQDKKRKIVSYKRRPVVSVSARTPEDVKQDTAPYTATPTDEYLSNVPREVKQSQRKVSITPTKTAPPHRRHRQPDVSMPTLPVPERNIFKKLVRNYSTKRKILAIVCIICCLVGMAVFYYLRQNDRPAQDTDGEPSVSQIAKYTVAADMPRYLKINALGVMSRIYPQTDITKGLTTFARNTYDTSWYQKSAAPGHSGVTLLAAVKGLSKGSDFNAVAGMVSGETIEVTMGNDTKYTYTTTGVVTIPKVGDLNISTLLAPHDTARQELKLLVITDPTQKDSGAFLIQAIRAD